jgi:hypothetical protein
VRRNKRAAFVLAQPGANAFFDPVLPILKERGWTVTEIDQSGDVAQQLASTNPTVVVTSTSHAAAERTATQWGCDHGTPAVQLVDSWYDYARRIEKTNGPGLMPDAIMVFDDDARRDAIGEGLAPDRLRVVGHPGWEDVQILPPASPSDVLIIDQPVKSDMGARLGYNEDDMLKVVGNGLGGGYRLHLAVHPRRQATPVHNLEPVSDIKTAARNCGTVIGMFSSFLIDAFLGGRRVISVQPNAGETDLCILSRLGLIPRVTEPKQFAAALTCSQSAPDKFAARFANSRGRVATVFESLLS